MHPNTLYVSFVLLLLVVVVVVAVVLVHWVGQTCDSCVHGAVLGAL
jgi:hypothetical protein